MIPVNMRQISNSKSQIPNSDFGPDNYRDRISHFGTNPLSLPPLKLPEEV
jgi:hypothetical protein